ncbi:MAG: methylmalonyl-CoA epimerase [candidate division WOR-3 bacterium]|nr:methylmalonyl-CoA epimerase [candidate division WOR-3 bacterium]
MLKSLNHIGIAVNSLNDSIKIYQDILGLGEPKIVELKEMKLRVAIFKLQNYNIELIEPLSPDTTIAKFLEKRGPGIHHLCFNVDNIEEKLAILKAKGVLLIDEKPRIGAMGNKIAFVSPKSIDGVLIELAESHE